MSSAQLKRMDSTCARPAEPSEDLDLGSGIRHGPPARLNSNEAEEEKVVFHNSEM